VYQVKYHERLSKASSSSGAILVIGALAGPPRWWFAAADHEHRRALVRRSTRSRRLRHGLGHRHRSATASGQANRESADERRPDSVVLTRTRWRRHWRRIDWNRPQDVTTRCGELQEGKLMLHARSIRCALPPGTLGRLRACSGA